MLVTLRSCYVPLGTTLGEKNRGQHGWPRVTDTFRKGRLTCPSAKSACPFALVQYETVTVCMRPGTNRSVVLLGAGSTDSNSRRKHPPPSSQLVTTFFLSNI